MHYNVLAAKKIANNVMQHKGHSVAAAFAENEIGRKGGNGSAQSGRSVIYNCLVLNMFIDTENQKDWQQLHNLLQHQQLTEVNSLLKVTVYCALRKKDRNSSHIRCSTPFSRIRARLMAW